MGTDVRIGVSEQDELQRLGRYRWITQDKRVLYLTQMTETHLKNVMAMLRLQANELRCASSFAHDGVLGAFASFYVRYAAAERMAQARLATRTADLIDRYLHLRMKVASDLPATA